MDVPESSLDYVIMIAIARMDSDRFRKDMFKSKRKELEEIWQGDTLNVAEIVRFAPSACNTQPWTVINDGRKLEVSRYLKPGKRGIMPADKVSYYNRIDLGIFLFLLETCMNHEGLQFRRTLYPDDGSAQSTLTAIYEYQK